MLHPRRSLPSAAALTIALALMLMVGVTGVVTVIVSVLLLTVLAVAQGALLVALEAGVHRHHPVEVN